MPKVTFTTADSDEITINAPAGMSLMKAAVTNDVPGIIGECGGDMSCATCHVWVDPEWQGKLPQRGEEEEELLEMVDGFQDRSRLSCQIKMSDELDSLRVSIPES